MTAPAVSALSPVDPSTLSDAEREQRASWLIRKLLGSVTGRIALASFESLRSSGLSVVCLSPWGDASPLMLPCIRLRDVAIHTAIAATGGTAAFAAPWMGTFSDVVVGSLGDTIVVEVGAVLAWDMGNKVATDLLFDKTAKLLPAHSKLLTTTSVKELTITLKYKHHNLTDATLGFFRASTVVHPDPSLFASVGEFFSTEKGWFAPYLQATARRPVIPRNFTPDVIFSHGPFLAGDYAIATRLALESATLINFAPAPVTSATGSMSTTVDPESSPPPRNMLLTVIGLAPHRFGMWTSSARPGESVLRYQLLNGCPALVIPVLSGSPLVSWNTMTLERLHSYGTELDAAGSVNPDSNKFNGIVDSLFEFVSLCVDWTRLTLPHPGGENARNKEGECADDMPKRCVRDAIALVVEGAVRSGLAKSAKVLKKDVDLSRAGIAMWRMP